MKKYLLTFLLIIGIQAVQAQPHALEGYTLKEEEYDFSRWGSKDSFS